MKESFLPANKFAAIFGLICPDEKGAERSFYNAIFPRVPERLLKAEHDSLPI
jgi:hypothetical protein